MNVFSAQRLALTAVGGTRERHFAGTNFKPHKLPENAHAAKRQSHHASLGVRCRGARCVSPLDPEEIKPARMTTMITGSQEVL
jgi:hypothetical protein